MRLLVKPSMSHLSIPTAWRRRFAGMGQLASAAIMILATGCHSFHAVNRIPTTGREVRVIFASRMPLDIVKGRQRKDTLHLRAMMGVEGRVVLVTTDTIQLEVGQTWPENVAAAGHRAIVPLQSTMRFEERRISPKRSAIAVLGTAGVLTTIVVLIASFVEFNTGF